MKRLQEFYIFDKKINAGKMIFLFGPRQVGKTTFALKRLKANRDISLYFNWDDPLVRRQYVQNPHFLKSYLIKSAHRTPLVVFDEIHKHKNWKNIIKGLYDLHREDVQFMITGSARLDYFSASGDSLVGRYFSYKMLPIGLPEAAQNFEFPADSDKIFSHPNENNLLKALNRVERQVFKKALNRLFEFGGFPEPFLKSDARFSIKWRRDYKSLLTKEDLRDLTRIQDIKGIEQLVLLLPDRIGSPLSINSLREDISVNHRTISNWLEALKKIYLIFSIMPWHQNITHSIKKESKFYFYDWTFVNNAGAKFKNMLAVMLLRLINRFNELGLGDFDIRYIRTKRGEEIDFLVIKNNKPFAMFEAKTSETDIIKSAHYFTRIFRIPYYQIVYDTDVIEAYPEDKYVIDASRFLALTG